MNDSAHLRRRTLLAVAATTAAPLFPLAARAQARAFPARPVTMVVPFAAGQSGDILARLLGNTLQKDWLQPLVIDNKGGAGGTIGSIAVARAPADGYTLLLGSSGPTTIAPSLYKNVGYDPDKDFTAICNVAGVPQVLMVPAASPYKTMGDLITAAKANPGKLTYGSGGKGSTAHLVMELFKSRAGIDIQHVPYRGAALAYPDLAAGRIDAMFDTTPAALPQIKGGLLRALAVSTAQRAPSLPEVPTVAEAGLAGFELLAWWGIVGPAKLPAAVRDQLNTDFRNALAAEEVKAKLTDMGMVPLAGTPAEFARFIHSEHAKFAALIKANNIVAD